LVTLDDDMDRFDEYRTYAAECQRMADATTKEDDKRQWLRLAQSWLTLSPVGRAEARPPQPRGHIELRRPRAPAAPSQLQ
jgi:hypothetical protein